MGVKHLLYYMYLYLYPLILCFYDMARHGCFSSDCYFSHNSLGVMLIFIAKECQKRDWKSEFNGSLDSKSRVFRKPNASFLGAKPLLLVTYQKGHFFSNDFHGSRQSLRTAAVPCRVMQSCPPQPPDTK